jgi:hypothetical protein
MRKRGRPPASSARELELVDALDRLSVREVARLVYGNARLYARVVRRRQERRRDLERFMAMSEAELNAFLDARLPKLD